MTLRFATHEISPHTGRHECLPGRIAHDHVSAYTVTGFKCAPSFSQPPYTHTEFSIEKLDTHSRRELWCADLDWKTRPSYKRQPPHNPGTARDFGSQI